MFTKYFFNMDNAFSIMLGPKKHQGLKLYGDVLKFAKVCIEKGLKEILRLDNV